LGKKLATVLKEKWLWYIILALILIVVVPLMVIWLITYLPPELKLVTTVLLIIGWGVAAGYKDWIVHKRKEEKQKRELG